MSGRPPALVETIWRVLGQFATDWEQAPYRWERERDIQMVLAARIDLAMHLLGEDVVTGRYTEERRFNRVGCEPRLYLDRKQSRYCFPDIVVWNSLGTPSDPPDRVDSWRGNWPVLWACEIKHDSADGGAEMDEAKLNSLIKSGDVQYGCVLNVKRGPGERRWHQKMPGGRLWRLDLRIPRASEERATVATKESV